MGPRLRIVTGKGGVGKSAVATAFALAETERGRTVLVAEVNGGDKVTSLLGVAPAGPHMREVMPRLWTVDMRADEAIHEYVLLTLRFETVYRAVFENRLVRGFVHLVPSLTELVMLGKLWYHERERVQGRPRFDAIVLDAPATGHAIALLGTPHAVEETVPPGPLRDIARNLQSLLGSPELTRLHVVTTPEEMPVNEALELERAATGSLGLALGTTVVNQRLAPLPEGALSTLAPLAAEPALAASVHALERREAKRLAGEAELARLTAPLLASVVSLPRLVRPRFGLAELRELAQLLDPVVAA